VVDDWQAFQEANRTPEPVAFRSRSALMDAGKLQLRLQASGFVTEPVQGVPDYFNVVSGPGSVAQTVEHWLGFLHVQQAVMALPSLALAPLPGERVLDLCAAPGGKTAHLSELMHERGPLVAVDPKEKRMRGLLGNLYRLGCMNVVVIAGDGRRLPAGALFDRVLVDAPCSGEGNYRRHKGRFRSASHGFTRHVTELQEALLRRAIALTRPGGTIVYSTCTYAPEENEAVLDRVLRDTPVIMERIPLDSTHAPGLTEWEGHRFDPQLQHAYRVYPHHMDSGGLFMARMRKEGSSDSSPVQSVAPPSESDGWSTIPRGFFGEKEDDANRRIERSVRDIGQRFGIGPSTLDEVRWMVRGKHIWSHTAGAWPVLRWLAEPDRRWRVISVGLRALRSGPGTGETPSSDFLTRWGGRIPPEYRFDVDAAGLLQLLDGRPLPTAGLPPGPVPLAWDGLVLGRAVVTAKGLLHELGRSHAQRLSALLRSPITDVSGDKSS
jgi:NOL1/NOP2/sun family putative RNA methylase